MTADFDRTSRDDRGERGEHGEHAWLDALLDEAASAERAASGPDPDRFVARLRGRLGAPVPSARPITGMWPLVSGLAAVALLALTIALVVRSTDPATATDPANGVVETEVTPDGKIDRIVEATLEDLEAALAAGDDAVVAGSADKGTDEDVYSALGESLADGLREGDLDTIAILAELDLLGEEPATEALGALFN